MFANGINIKFIVLFERYNVSVNINVNACNLYSHLLRLLLYNTVCIYILCNIKYNKYNYYTLEIKL